jgi:hypothetical protein
VGVAGKGINLGGLYAVGQAFIRNVVIAGDLTPAAANPGFFSLPSTTPGGIDLPLDTIAVAAAGDLPAASIIALDVPSIAFGSAAGVLADNAKNGDALVPLASGTGVSQANDTFLLFVGDLKDVAQFLVTTGGGSFDQKGLLFGDQLADNKPVTAKVVVVASGSQSSVQEVDFTGNFAALNTSQPVTTTISNPNGSLGDLILKGSQGISANVTAASILGNIEAVNGSISGTIETTVGDFGRFLTDATGKITGVTHVSTGGGGLTSTGQIIATGNLVSQVTVQSGIDGTIAANGDIGALLRDANGNAIVGTDRANSLTRFGGITVTNGGLNGDIVALGNVFGDISITGGVSGRLAAKGKVEYGLPSLRIGFLGNISIGGGISGTGAIVSGGLIGDDGTNNGTKEVSQGTQLTISGTTKGIIAAEEDINFGKTGSINQTNVFENVGSPTSPKYDGGQNKTQIDNIFTNNGSALTIPGGLSFILADLNVLAVDATGNLTGTTA